MLRPNERRTGNAIAPSWLRSQRQEEIALRTEGRGEVDHTCTVHLLPTKSSVAG